MKRIEAIIRRAALAKVTEALAREGIQGLTVADVVRARRREFRDCYRGIPYPVADASAVRIDLVADELGTETFARVIRTVAVAGEAGEASIQLHPVAAVPSAMPDGVPESAA